LPKPKAKPPQAPRSKDEGLRSVLPFAALALLVLLSYANSFRAGFVFDNRVLLLEDTRLRALSASNLDLILEKPYWWPFADTPLYRPATTLSYLVNYSLFGNADRPLGYHVVNALLHTMNVWLVFGLALRMGRRLWPAIFVAAVWAVHPLSTEAVTNIVGRADLLAAFGVLAAFSAHLEATDARGTRRWSWMAVSLAAMTVAVFSKESAVAGVGIIVLYDVLWPEKPFRTADVVLGWIIITLPVAVFLYQRAAVLGGSSVEVPYVDNPIAGAAFWTGRLTALSVMGRYIALLLWPAHLSADYSFSQIPLAHGSVSDWLAWIVIVALAIVALAAARVNRMMCFSLAGAFITFLPAANLLFTTGTIMAERLMYLPSAFLLAASVAAIYSVATMCGIRSLAPGVLSLAMVLCGVRTFVRNADWYDDLRLWTATARTAPDSFKSHDSLAEALYQADPAHDNIGRVTEEKEESLAILQALSDPDTPPRPYRAGASYYLEDGDWLQMHKANVSDVAKAYKRAAELGERYLALAAAHQVPAREISDAQLLVSTAYNHLDQSQRALDSARRAAADQPFNPAAYRDITVALLNENRLDDAAVELLTGFIVTGDEELRRVLIGLYRNGLDASGCATTVKDGRASLNVSCEIVRRHLCAAAVRATGLQRDNGHPELAAQVAVITRDANCVAPGTP
jgi:tetratricopeptide (TPR) repeat protein